MIKTLLGSEWTLSTNSYQTFSCVVLTSNANNCNLDVSYFHVCKFPAVISNFHISIKCLELYHGKPGILPSLWGFSTQVHTWLLLCCYLPLTTAILPVGAPCLCWPSMGATPLPCTRAKNHKLKLIWVAAFYYRFEGCRK